MNSRLLRILLKAVALTVLFGSLSACVSAGTGWYTDYAVSEAPPPIPYYAQPPCPGAGYIWQPGYWAWGVDGYYWEQGEWVLPPEAGEFWTPGYWNFDGDSYLWIGGHWGFQVGYYGGIDYGYGYFGDGFDGGYWEGDEFIYNAAVLNVGPDFDGHIYRDRPDFGHDRGHFWGHPDWHDGFGDGRRGGRDGFHGGHNPQYPRYRGFNPAGGRFGQGFHGRGAHGRGRVIHNPSWPMQGARGAPQEEFHPQIRPPAERHFQPQFRPQPHAFERPAPRMAFRPAPRGAPGFSGAGPRFSGPRGGHFGPRARGARPPMRR